MTASANGRVIPLPFSQVLKRIFLGKPLVSEHLESESLSNTVALGALSPDAISSTVYGPEQIWSNCCQMPGWPRTRCCFRSPVSSC